MFHAVALTPEAPSVTAALHGSEPDHIIAVGPHDIRAARAELDRGPRSTLAAICLGAPHYSLAEFAQLLGALRGRRVHAATRLVVATSRHNRRVLEREGTLDGLTQAGVEVIADTCTYYGRVPGGLRGTVMTNSAKWAHYAPGNLGVDVLFARLADCVETAVRGVVTIDESFWST